MYTYIKKCSRGEPDFVSAENADRKLFRSADLPAAALHFPRSKLRKVRTPATHFFTMQFLISFVKLIIYFCNCTQ